MQTAYRPSRKRRSKKKRRMLLQRIFHNIHFYFPVRKERYPVRFLHGLDHGSHHLLPVVDKDLRAEPIQDHPQLQMPVLTPNPASSLVDHRFSGTRELPVYLQDILLRPEAE